MNRSRWCRAIASAFGVATIAGVAGWNIREPSRSPTPARFGTLMPPARPRRDMDQEALIEALRAADAVQFGEFELSHGGTSEYYVDKYLFETDPAALELVAEAFAERTGDERLAGVALGAVPIVAATSIAAGAPYVIVRKAEKEYGTGNRIEGRLPGGERVVVLEDVATTGTSALDAVEALRDAGAVVERVLVVVDRQEGAAELLADHDVALESLVTAEALLDAADR